MILGMIMNPLKVSASSLHQVCSEERPHEDEAEDDGTEGIDPFFPKRYLMFISSEDVPSDDRREGEEEQTDSEEDHSSSTEGLLNTVCVISTD